MDQSIKQLKDKHLSQDIWIVAGGPSLDHIPFDFFDNKISIGVNQAYRKFRTTYLVRKELFGLEEAARQGIQLIVAEYDCGDLNSSKNHLVEGVLYFEHLQNHCTEIDFSVLGSDKLIVSYSTITSAMHLAAYMGAKNIILCGHDCGSIDGKMTFSNYSEFTYNFDYNYDLFVHNIRPQTIKVRSELKKFYGTNTYSLSPYIGYDLEGHVWSQNKKKHNSICPSFSELPLSLQKHAINFRQSCSNTSGSIRNADGSRPAEAGTQEDSSAESR